ncbi:Alpha/Beta hydrolase protein [Catenaria anguillulae PL171]|uniref:Alpha/Beta hydrolase protein n=1 Tax=Catenaria anguillulae PL171 TaxID=765915 RepID=A0A1Y2HMM8_9FUNG|nr:Alpha/Beta hydrolase protein [Catenaria anguillulae PL171]
MYAYDSMQFLLRRGAGALVPFRPIHLGANVFAPSSTTAKEAPNLCRPRPGTATPANTTAPSTSPASQCIDSAPGIVASPSTNGPAIEFPCLDRLDAKTLRIAQALSAASSPASSQPSSVDTSGPEPSYATTKLRGYKVWKYDGSLGALHLDLGGTLPTFDLAYETWGKLNADRSNVILLGTGLSASSHARSHQDNPDRGWWEDFIGPGLPLDTNKFFIICTNALGGCFGSTGPSSPNPSDTTGAPYATRFPAITIWDQVRAQHLLLKHGLGIDSVHAAVGASMGGMQMQAYSAVYPDSVGRLVSISSCARAHPYSIALRFVQRQVLMADPAYASTRGNYYGQMPPHVGMKLARSIATITYRSGPEWERRFGRQRTQDQPPSLCPDFLIEQYLDHQGEKFSLSYDANSLLYLSKAMDLYDMSVSSKSELASRKRSPFEPAQPIPQADPSVRTDEDKLKLGMSELTMPTLVLGVTSDILFPLPQQAEIATTLRETGNHKVTYYVLDAEYGHDTFLIDKVSVGAAVAGHLV